MWSLFLGGVTPAHDQRDLAEHADRLGEMLNGRDRGIGITASSGKRPSGHPYHCEYRRQGVSEAGVRGSRDLWRLRARAAAGGMQRDALLLSFFGPRYKKAAPCGAA